MGDDEQGAAAGGPAGARWVGQPVDALDVEVVGGLVEHEQVVVAEQHRGQRHPAPLPTGQLGDQRVVAPGHGDLDVGQQPAEHRAHRGVARPGVGAGRQPLRAEHVLEHGAVGLEVGLVEVADPQAAAVGHPPAVQVLPLHQGPQQRGLAVAVAADDADPVAVVEAEAHGVEDGAGGEHDGRVLGVQQVGHGAAHPRSPDRPRPPAGRCRRPPPARACGSPRSSNSTVTRSLSTDIDHARRPTRGAARARRPPGRARRRRRLAARPPASAGGVGAGVAVARRASGELLAEVAEQELPPARRWSRRSRASSRPGTAPTRDLRLGRPRRRLAHGLGRGRRALDPGARPVLVDVDRAGLLEQVDRGR